MTRRAVIDVGTNSIKLLVADVGQGNVRPVLEESEQTRLGAGFFSGNRLQPAAIAATAQAVGRFAGKARGLNAVSIRIIATSAARDAVNPEDLTGAIQQASGLAVEIISGDQEADLAFQGVTTDPELAKKPLLIMDVGGGSTEFILGQGAHKHFRQSFQLGTVRLLEKLAVSDPPPAAQLAGGKKFVADFLAREVKPLLEPALRQQRKSAFDEGLQFVGTGGTATILARMQAKLETYDRARLEGLRIPLAEIQAQTARLWRLSLAERQTIPGLPPNRADVILCGALIYEGVMETFGLAELRITTRGLRFAALLDA